MQCNFDIIHAPNCAHDSSLQIISSDLSCCIKNHEKNIFQQKINQIDFNPFQNADEMFFKKKCIIYKENNVKWTDDILIENMNIPYESYEKKMNFRKRLLFDISSINRNNDNFYKHKKFFDEISDVKCHDDINTKLMPHIEPFIIERNNLLLNNSINYKKRLNYDIENNESFNFTLKKKDFSTFTDISLPHDIETKLITSPLEDLDSLTSSMYIPNESDHINSDNNIFIDPIIKSESYFDNFIQSMRVILLKFNCEQMMCFEPFTIEWLKDLNISKKDFDEQIEGKRIFNSQLKTSKNSIFKNLNRIQVSVKGDITEEFSPIISKILKNEESLNFTNSQQMIEIMEAIQKEYAEKEIPSIKMATLVQINSLFFSDEDIANFEKLFQNLRFIKTELDKKLLFTINDKIANVLIIDDDFNKNISNIINILKIFGQVIITTTMKPCICLPERIKWRNITSHSQIAAAILPYLIEENSNATKESIDENNPK